jgi:hypothetical protein
LAAAAIAAGLISMVGREGSRKTLPLMGFLKIFISGWRGKQREQLHRLATKHLLPMPEMILPYNFQPIVQL